MHPFALFLSMPPSRYGAQQRQVARHSVLTTVSTVGRQSDLQVVQLVVDAVGHHGAVIRLREVNHLRDEAHACTLMRFRQTSRQLCGLNFAICSSSAILIVPVGS